MSKKIQIWASYVDTKQIIINSYSIKIIVIQIYQMHQHFSDLLLTNFT